VTCDSCGATVWGASRRDVLEAGWKFHVVRGGTEFVMCGDCENKYALFRRARITRPSSPEREHARRAA
jgi:hypothetical protein